MPTQMKSFPSQELMLVVMMSFSLLLGSPAIHAQEINEIQLIITAPFSTAMITMDHLGNVKYEANSPKTGLENQSETSKITPEQFNELVELINKNNFFSYENTYENDDLTDLSTVVVSVKKDNQIKSVSCYGECPGPIMEIIYKIRALWGKEILEIGV